MSSSEQDPTSHYKLPEPPPGYVRLPWGQSRPPKEQCTDGLALWLNVPTSSGVPNTTAGVWELWPYSVSDQEYTTEHAWNCIFAVPAAVPPASTTNNRMIRVVVIREGVASDFAFHPDHVVFMEPSTGSPEMTVVTTASNGFFVVKEPFASLYNRTYLV
jgi:hypothetical protein